MNYRVLRHATICIKRAHFQREIVPLYQYTRRILITNGNDYHHMHHNFHETYAKTSSISFYTIKYLTSRSRSSRFCYKYEPFRRINNGESISECRLSDGSL